MLAFKGHCATTDAIFFNFYGYADCEIHLYHTHHSVLSLRKEVTMYPRNTTVRAKIGNEEMSGIYTHVNSTYHTMTL